MEINPIATIYLTMVYKGELVIKEANLEKLHKWAGETLTGLFELYMESMKEDDSVDKFELSPANTAVSMGLLPENVQPFFPREKLSPCEVRGINRACLVAFYVFLAPGCMKFTNKGFDRL